MDVRLKTAHLLKSKHDARVAENSDTHFHIIFFTKVAENSVTKRQKMTTVAENSSHLINSQYAIILFTDYNHFIYLYSQLMQQSRRNKEKAENKEKEKIQYGKHICKQ